MGEQIHIGGLGSSQDLLARAQLAPGARAVDLCCCSGAGCRFLVRSGLIAHATGVDMTSDQLALGAERNRRDGCADRVNLVLGYASRTDLPAGAFDLVWGEDAWCYVGDKNALAHEAARLLKPGGTLACTDWCAGPGLTDAEADRFLAFMKFPSLASIAEWQHLFEIAGLTVHEASDTGRFAPACDLYLAMLTQQLTSDALRIIGWNQALFATLGGELAFVQSLAHQGKLVQGRFIAKKL